MERRAECPRLGMIVPTSNTCVEPVTYRLLGGTHDVSVHFARVDIAHPDFSSPSGGQGMTSAARQLADAEVDAVIWNGSSGSWLGIERDRDLCENLSRICNAPATSSTLALLESCRVYGVSKLGLATPYTAEVNAKIAREYAGCGVDVVAESHLGITDNAEYARVPEEVVAEGVRAVAPNAHAATILCTNLNGAFLAPGLERELGIPVFDSVAVTLWHALRLVAPTSIGGFGTLLRDGALFALLQDLCDSLRSEVGADRIVLQLDLPELGLWARFPTVESVRPGMRSLHEGSAVDSDRTRAGSVPGWSLRNFVPGATAQLFESIKVDGSLIGLMSVQSVSEHSWTMSDQAAKDATRRAAGEVASILGRCSPVPAVGAPL
ncbi:hypothetical protein SPF06_13385 [Sinomonas sp. JGH33]|uniref:Asp/Glu racemase n=1 Tax=Sinomonas terricola TaxID=3110330 RepID=A0ABU5T9D8_9MICC|nr:hypothetical protein [Sinomonas sp. JGH33]MEA5455721.1 hypothetical protein [Sinomonas sp. JGH33]